MTATKRLAARAMVALVLGVVMLGGATAPPVQADPGFVPLAGNTWSPQYEVAGCKYRVVYLGYGSTPVGGVRYYGPALACRLVSISVRSADSNGVHWTSDTGSDGGGTDGCGAYTYVQVEGPNPGYATGVRFNFNKTSMSYDGDGDTGQTPLSYC
jgi:hypothetical protein